MASHILFITTSNLATNPRTLKEIRLALEHGMKVSLICFSFDNWSRDINAGIKAELQEMIEYIELAGNRKPFLPWLMSSFMYSCAGAVTKLFPRNTYWLSLRSNKRSWLLMRCLNRYAERPDIVVAHNVGSFYPALLFARKGTTALGIDLEDYHPGESTKPVVTRNTIQLLKNVLPDADYITAASPLILAETLKHVDVNCPTEVVLNYFNAEEFRQPAEIDSDKLQLVWFSQNISFGRGLEQVIPVVEKLENVELHLIGNCNAEFSERWLKARRNIHIHSALSQPVLHKTLAEFDIGLAIEPGKDRNNELAISNKILAYFQAGLFILASDTPAQQDFLSKHPHAGIVTALNANSFREALTQLVADKDKLRAKRIERYRKAREFSWEREGERVVALWKTIVQRN